MGSAMSGIVEEPERVRPTGFHQVHIFPKAAQHGRAIGVTDNVAGDQFETAVADRVSHKQSIAYGIFQRPNPVRIGRIADDEGIMGRLGLFLRAPRPRNRSSPSQNQHLTTRNHLHLP